MHETRRTQRVADQLLQEIADILQRQVKDPRVTLVTITGVDVSPDLRVATVHYTCSATEGDQQTALSGLNSASPYVRRELGRRLRLKVLPELRFRFDDSLERGFRIQGLLEGIKHEPKP